MAYLLAFSDSWVMPPEMAAEGLERLWRLRHDTGHAPLRARLCGAVPRREAGFGDARPADPARRHVEPLPRSYVAASPTSEISRLRLGVVRRLDPLPLDAECRPVALTAFVTPYHGRDGSMLCINGMVSGDVRKEREGLIPGFVEVPKLDAEDVARGLAAVVDVEIVHRHWHDPQSLTQLRVRERLQQPDAGLNCMQLALRISEKNDRVMLRRLTQCRAWLSRDK